MKYITPITTTLLGSYLVSFHSLALADPVVQVNTGVESTRFIDGQNISGDKPTINLGVDVSFNNGAFAGLDCYKTETQVFNDGIDAGCNYYVGYFQPLNNDQAFSATVSRSEYAPIPGPARQWDYTSAALSWHTNRSTIVTLSATDNWFGRGSGAIGLNATYQHTLSEEWSANLEAGLVDFESSSQRSSINYARLGFRFEQGRWSTQLNLHLNNNDSRNFTPFEVDEADISLSLNYRLY